MSYIVCLLLKKKNLPALHRTPNQSYFSLIIYDFNLVHFYDE